MTKSVTAIRYWACSDRTSEDNPFCTSGMNGIEKAAEHIKGILGETVTVAAGKRLGAEAT
ncbi:MAG: hypothetical protein IJT27_05465 [Clostridia bacterium]|nr:hypothetical protein [Clostridia bacterium]